MSIYLIVLAVIILLIVRVNRSRIKGSWGEYKVAKQLKKLNPEEYKVINRLLFRTEDRSCQIDHVVVSRFGIYVIETKNFKGWIHGADSSEYWVQSIYSQKNEFRNPVKQNWSHVYALKDILWEYGKITYHPIVVFAGRAQLRNVYSSTPVIYRWNLCDTILYNRTTPCLSAEQVNDIACRLNNVNRKFISAKRDHVQQVRHEVFERERKIESLICPKCNSNLVIRNGQYGQFYGCSNYPQCKYTLKR